jgi:D-arginine dehydrogenase
MDVDVVVIGAGMAGSSAAAWIAASQRVALIEAEEVAGYHTTGRSAAMWLRNYGPPDVRLLSRLSRAFFTTPPKGFTEVPLMRHRPVLFLGAATRLAELAVLLAEGEGLRQVDEAEAMAMVPALRRGYACGAAIEADAFDMDVSAIQQGFLRQLRARGGVFALRNRAGLIERRGGTWHVETSAGTTLRAEVVVNAAGAWGDEVAGIAGVAPISLRPLRRTASIIDPAPFEVAEWPMIIDAGRHWYARPEARTRLLVTPEDETPSYPHDVQPEEMDIALGIDRMRQALAIDVRRVERSWAGLRTFTPDGSLAFGWDKDVPGFFWCVGQGGYGIQTSPAAGRLVANLVAERDCEEATAILSMIDPARFRVG